MLQGGCRRNSAGKRCLLSLAKCQYNNQGGNQPNNGHIKDKYIVIATNNKLGTGSNIKGLENPTSENMCKYAWKYIELCKELFPSPYNYVCKAADQNTLHNK